ncbi:O-antigen ligase family protein [Pseudoalteromonas rhizosphaerae]|uniref:O-antigen ligase family protein n=1 Tax=Pseudoalteromonas rhizosphaerae TaxID=2518973 RepID=UPI00384D6D3B
MFTLDRIKSLYFFYTCIVLISFSLSVNVVPLEFRWVLNKLFYVVSFLFLLFYVYGCSTKLNLKKITFLIALLIYIVFYSLSKFVNYPSFQAVANIISGGLLYSIVLVIFILSVKVFPVSLILKPFCFSFIIIISISTFVLLGGDIAFYIDAEAMSFYEKRGGNSSFLGFSGVYLNQNSFAIINFLAMATFIAWYFQLSFVSFGNRNTWKIFVIIFIFISFIFVLLTLSRSSIMITGLFLLLISLKGSKNKSVLILSVLVFLALVLVFYMLNDLIVGLTERVTQDGTSLRGTIWMDAFLSIKSNFYFGVGYYNYVNEWGVELSAHNAYIQRFASDGFFVFMLFISFLLFTLLRGVKIILFRRFTDNPILIIFSVSFISLLIHQFFENIINNPFSPVTLFIFLIIGFIYQEKLKANE